MAGTRNLWVDGACVRDFCRTECKPASGRQDVPKGGVGIRASCVLLAHPSLRCKLCWHARHHHRDHLAVHVLCGLEHGESLPKLHMQDLYVKATVGLC